MSESRGRRSSKWDLKNAPEFASGSMQDDVAVSFHDKDRESGSLREHASGGRGSRKNDCLNKDSLGWDEDGSYSTRMSPGLDEWRQRRGHSPRGAWRRPMRSRSRSRSRSPSRGIKREYGVNDRNRSKSGLSTPLCKDFASGRCAKGGRCQFSHHSAQNYDDMRYPYDTREHSVKSGGSYECCSDFLRGKCRKGASCKYPHHGASDGFIKSRADEIIREREDDRGNRGASFDHGGEREPRRGSDIPCKFFAAGNCRNGKHCRFSHYVHTSSSSEGRLREGRWGTNHNGDNPDQLKGSSRWKDTTLSGCAELGKERNGKVVAPDRWDNSLDNGDRARGSPTFIDKAAVRDSNKSFQWKDENADHGMGVSKYKGTDEWMGDAMSPEWNPKVRSPRYMNKNEPHHVAQSSQPLNLNEPTYLPISVKNLPREAPSQMHRAAAADTLPNDFEKSYIHHNDNNGVENNSTSYNDVNFSNFLSQQSFKQNEANRNDITSLNAVGLGQLAYTLNPPSGESLKDPLNLLANQDERLVFEPEMGNADTLRVASEVVSTQNVVSKEQLVQLTNLSASLSQLFGNGQQLPHLYATLKTPKCTETLASLPNSSEFVSSNAMASIKPNPDTESQKQYDPLCDSLAHMKSQNAHQPPEISPFIEQKIVEDDKREVCAGELNGGESCTTPHYEGNLSQETRLLKQSDPVANQPNENEEMVPDQKRNAEEEIEEAQEGSQLKNIDEDGREDGGKKGKDLKVIRAFKFALVESVKELLKPTWKEGHIDKEAYKIIVKKVADKVTSTIQVAHIPQAQEKIDQYLSSSKPKITKLVQAYVERHQKTQN